MNHQQPKITPLPDLIKANIDGQQIASLFISTVHSFYADPDVLYSEVKKLIPEITDLKTLSTIRGFCRGLQKHIEVRQP